MLQQGRLPRPLRRARQGLDRPRRGPLAGAVLAHRRRDGGLLILQTAVDEGLGACFFGIPPEHARRRPRGVRDPRRPTTRSARSRSATAAPTRRRARARRRAGRARAWTGRPPRPLVALTTVTRAPPCRTARSRSCRRWSGSRRSPTATPTQVDTDAFDVFARRARAAVPAAPRAARADPRPHPRPALPMGGARAPSAGRADGAPRRRTRRGRGWQHPALRRRTIPDGGIWGRGTLDDKGCLVAICEAVETLLEPGTRRRRTCGCPSAATRRSSASRRAEAVEELRRARRHAVARARRGRCDRVRRVPRRQGPAGRDRGDREGRHLDRADRRGARRARLDAGRLGPTARLARAITRLDNAPIPAQRPGPDARAVPPARAARAAPPAAADGQRRPARPAAHPRPARRRPGGRRDDADHVRRHHAQRIAGPQRDRPEGDRRREHPGHGRRHRGRRRRPRPGGGRRRPGPHRRDRRQRAEPGLADDGRGVRAAGGHDHRGLPRGRRRRRT